jgi:DNA-binding transcriptional regulator YhcF (GntR family)
MSAKCLYNYIKTSTIHLKPDCGFMAQFHKYDQVRFDIINYIACNNLKKGDRLPSEQKMAEIFNVSSITLRRALSEFEKENIIEKKHGSGAFLKKKLTKNPCLEKITFIEIVDTLQCSTAVHVHFMQERLAEFGLHLQNISCTKPGRHVIEQVEDSIGIFVSGWLTKEWYDFLVLFKIPVVIIGSHPNKNGIATVKYNWREAAELLVSHFHSLGYGNIGLINGAASYYPSVEIFEGYQSMLKKIGLPFNKDKVLWTSPETIYGEIEDFLNKETGLDAILLEVGTRLPFFTCCWDNDYPRKPCIGIPGIPEEGLEKSLKFNSGRIVKAVFHESVYAKAINVMFNLLKSDKKMTIENVSIDPVII